MIKIVLAAVIAVVMAQWRPTYLVDSIHGFRMEYDDRHNLVMMVNRTHCFVVEHADDGHWDAIVKSNQDLHDVSEQLYDQIKAGTGLTSLTREQETQYHSTIERFSCIRHQSYKIDYTPPTGN